MTPSSPLRAPPAWRWVGLGLLAWCLCGLAQAEWAPLRFWRQNNGLGNLTVQAMAEDPSGIRWVGTENGLYRFDGRRFERVGREQGVAGVTVLHTDASGRIWVGTERDLYLLNHDTLTLVRDGPRALPVTRPQALASAGEQLWVVSGEHLLQMAPITEHDWQPDLSTPALPADLGLVHSVLRTPDGTLWLGCGDAVCEWREGHLVRWGAAQGLPAGIWQTLLRSRDGGLWARSGRHLRYKAPGANGFIERLPAAADHDPNAWTQPLLEDGQGRILATVPHGLLRWDGERWQRFGTPQGWPGTRVRTLWLDPTDGLWLGAAGNGLGHWQGYGEWRSWTQADGLPDDVVWSVQHDADGRLHAATRAGVAWLDEHDDLFVRDAVAPPARSTGETIAIARTPDGWLWTGNRTGELLRSKGGASWQVVASLPTLVTFIRVTDDGGLWIGTQSGLFKLGPGAAESGATPQAEAGLANESVAAACTARDGTAWAWASGALWRRSGTQWQRASGVPQAAVEGKPRLLCSRDGSLYLAGLGLGRLTPRPGDTFQWDDITPEPLRDSLVVTLIEDHRGWLWLASDGGLAVWNRSHWQTADQRDGLVWNDTSGGGLSEDTDGSIWVSTSHGLSQLQAPEQLFAVRPPAIAIRWVERAGQRWQPGTALTVPWAQDSLNVTLDSAELPGHRATQIRYRLVGLDDQWAPVDGRELRFAALEPGRYRLEVMAVHRLMQRSSAVAGFVLDVLPPWWRGTPFRATLLALLALVITLIYRWRQSALKAAHEHLEQLVAERTHELEASREALRLATLKDALTGAWNRRALDERLVPELARLRRGDATLTLVMADIDHFKRINDRQGHPAGDAVLVELVRRWSAAVRPYDLVVRHGGEEFILLLPGLDADLPEHLQRLHDLHTVVTDLPFALDSGELLPVSCSFGVVCVGPEAMDVTQTALVHAADQALYCAKANGRNRIEHAPVDTLIKALAAPRSTTAA